MYSSSFSFLSPCAAALHQPVSGSAVRRVKAGFYYVADVQWNADEHCMHSSTPPPLYNPHWSVSELSLWGRRLTASAWAKLQAQIISFLSLHARGSTLSHCEITPFQRSSHPFIAEVRGRAGVRGWQGLGAEKEHSVPEKCSTGSLLLSTNRLLNGWWDHIVWRNWLASVSVRRRLEGHLMGTAWWWFFLSYGRDSWGLPHPFQMSLKRKWLSEMDE